MGCAGTMTNVASNWVRSLSEQSKKWSNYWKQTQSKLNSGRSTEQVGLKSYLEVLLSTQDGRTSVGREFHILGLLPECSGPRNNKSPVVGRSEGCSTGNSRCACQTFSWAVLPMAALYTRRLGAGFWRWFCPEFLAGAGPWGEEWSSLFPQEIIAWIESTTDMNCEAPIIVWIFFGVFRFICSLFLGHLDSYVTIILLVV